MSNKPPSSKPLSVRRLALDGGDPTFPDGPPIWPGPEDAVQAALARVYADGHWGRYDGPYVGQLTECLATRHEVSHVQLCSSGTIAVELALRGLRVGEGDEVILAGYDFPGNFRCIEAVGARPVLIDLAPGSWTIDAATIEQALSPQVRTVIVSHLHGSLADMAAIRELSNRHGITVIEDACQATGATVQGKPAGSWGDAGILSFGGSKLLTAGRGGAVLTDRADVAQRMKVFSERGNDAFPLSQLQAAVLAPQLGTLNERNRIRLQNVRRLLEQIGDLPWLTPLTVPASADATATNLAESEPAFYKLPWLVGPGCNNEPADEPAASAGESARSLARRLFTAALRAEGVAMDEGFRGFARRSSARCRVAGPLRYAARVAEATAILHHPVLLASLETIDRLAAVICEVAAELPARIHRASAADE